MLELREITFIRDQLTQEMDLLPKIMEEHGTTLVAFIEKSIEREIARMVAFFNKKAPKDVKDDLLIKENQVINDMRIGKIRRQRGNGLRYHEKVPTVNIDDPINPVDYFYRIIVQDIMDFMKVVMKPIVDKVMQEWRINV